MEISAEKFETAAEELRRLNEVREIQRRLAAGEHRTMIAKQVGISWQRVEKLRWQWSGVSVSEQVKYTAVHDLPRDELIAILSEVEYVFHGYDSVADYGYDINLDWWPLQVMVREGFLAPDEYESVCESQIAISRDVLARPHCDPRTCDEHDAHVYVVCYGERVMVKSRDWHAWDDRAQPYPISHYVGITRQKPAVKRLWQHAVKSAQHAVAVMPGTEYEESVLKAFGTCPRCARSLDYFAENETRDHDNPLTGYIKRPGLV